MAAARTITRLSVSQLVGPAWCEYQYHYGLLTHARLPPEARPATLDLGHGQTLTLSRPALLRRARTLAAGTAVHELLEQAAPQAHVAATAAALLPLAVREVDRYAARCVQIASACALLRRSPGIAREVPVLGSVHGILVRGVIDEIAALPRRRAPSPSSGPPGSQPVDGWTYQIRDSKTRRSSRLPPPADQRGARMQCMIYKRLWDGLCLAALGHTQPLPSTEASCPPVSPSGREEASTPVADGGFDPNAEPLTLAALKAAAGIEEESQGQLSAAWCDALQPVLRSQSEQAWARHLSEHWEPARPAATPQPPNFPPPAPTSPRAVPEATEGGTSSVGASDAESEADGPDGPLSLQDVYNAMLIEVRLWMGHARDGAEPRVRRPDPPSTSPRRRGRPKRSSAAQSTLPFALKRSSAPDTPSAFAWSAIDPALVLMYRSRKRSRSESSSKSETDSDTDSTSSEPTVERSGASMERGRKAALATEPDDPPADGLFGDVLSHLDEAITLAQQGVSEAPLSSAPAGFVPLDPSAPDATLLGQVCFGYDGAVLEAFLRSMVRLWRRERYVQGVPPALTQRCNYCEFRDGCQWRLGMSHEHLNGFLGAFPTFSPLITVEEEPDRWKQQLLGVPPTEGSHPSDDGAAVTASKAFPVHDSHPVIDGMRSSEAGETFVPLNETLSVWPPPPPAPPGSDGEQSLWLDGPSPTDAEWESIEAMLRHGPTDGRDDHPTGSKTEKPKEK